MSAQGGSRQHHARVRAGAQAVKHAVNSLTGPVPDGPPASLVGWPFSNAIVRPEIPLGPWPSPPRATIPLSIGYQLEVLPWGRARLLVRPSRRQLLRSQRV